MITVIVPTLNEKDNVEPLAERVSEVLNQEYELIFVDHDSDDGTVEKIEHLEQESKNIRKILRNSREGLGAAIIQGFEVAEGDTVVQMDADFSHPVERLPDLVDEIENGKDLAVGSRYVEGGERNDPLHRRVFPMIGRFLYTRLLGSSVQDFTSGFKAYNRETVEMLLENKNSFPTGFHFQASSLFYLLENDVDVAEVPIEFAERRTGEPKYRIRDLIDNGLLFGKLFAEKHHRFWKFGVVGASGALINMAILFGFTEFLGFHYLVSSAIAVESSIISNFILNDIWTFAERGGVKIKHVLSRFIKYNLVSLSGLTLNLLILWFLTDLVGIYYLVSNLIAIAVVFSWNYVFSDGWAWSCD